ncbi:MAG: hypothetical protein C3F07_08880 [Anaerolineales bacterium]|nr:TIR domain-containing protein [Anaerolineae bacterium]PWB73835.1 MAG: hypothetical protein C3F07_08880 [Anaerolineales bacterium]
MNNDKHKVYISYAWGGESERVANELDAILQAGGITIIRDKRDLGYKGMIRNFMQEIGRGHAVIVIISDKYLKSPNCMFELVEIAKSKDTYDRIFPIVLEDADIYDPVNRIEYIKHWEEKINTLDKAMKSIGSANQQGLRDEIDSYDEIRDNIADLTFMLKDMNTLTKEMHEDGGFTSLISAIKERLEKPSIDNSRAQPTHAEQIEDLLETALRKLGHPSKIYHRTNIEDEILETVLGDEHPVTFLYGLPGSGKTILLGETAKGLHQTYPGIFALKFSGVFAAEPAYFLEELNEFLNRSNGGMDLNSLTNQDWRHSLEILAGHLSHIKQSVLLLDSVDQAPEGLIDFLMELAPQTKMVMTARSRVIPETKALFISIPPLQERETSEFLTLFGNAPGKEDEHTDWLERIPKKIKENPQQLKLLIANLRDIPLELLLADGMDELSRQPSRLIHAIVQDLSEDTLRVFSLIILLEGLELFSSLKVLNIALPKDLRKALTDLIGKSLIYRQGDIFLVPSLVRESAVEKITKAIRDETVEQVEQAIREASNALQQYYDQFNELFPIIANFFFHLEELKYNEEIINLATEDLIETMNLQGFWKEYRLILRTTYEAAKSQNNPVTLADIGFRIVRKSFQIRDMQSGRRTLSELENIQKENPDLRLSAEILSHRALFTEQDGDVEGALDQLQRSFQIYKDLGDEESMFTLQTLIGNIFLRQKDIARARQSYETALAQDNMAAIPSKHILDVKTNIAVCDYIEEKLDNAEVSLHDIIRMCKETGYLAGLPRVYYFLAQVMDRKNQDKEALRFAELAVELALKSEQPIARGAQLLVWKINNRGSG